MRFVAFIATTAIVVLKSGASLAGDKAALDLAKAFGMDQRWTEKVVAPAIDAYIGRARSSPQPPPEQELARMRSYAIERMSWERVGTGAVSAAYGKCDDQTLIGMRRIADKEDIAASDRERITAAFEQCTKDANRLLAEYLSKVMQAVLQENP